MRVKLNQADEWISEQPRNLPNLKCKAAFFQSSVSTQLVGSNSIRDSHRLFYRIAFSASGSSMTCSIEPLLSAHSWAFFSHCHGVQLCASRTCSLSKPFTKAALQGPICASKDGGDGWWPDEGRWSVWSMMLAQSAKPPGACIELLCFSWKFQLIPGISLFSIKEWGQIWFPPDLRDNLAERQLNLINQFYTELLNRQC